MANLQSGPTNRLKHLAGKTLNVADKLLTGAGAVADAIGKVAPGIVDEGAKVIDVHLDKHKDDFKMPGLIDLPLTEAQRVMDFYHLQYSLIPVTPAVKYAGCHPNVILETTPKANAKVAPNTFVRAYYADEDAVATSQQILASQVAEKKARKAKKQAARQAHLVAATHLATAVPAAVAHRLPHRRSKTAPQPPDQTPADNQPNHEPSSEI